jgi:RodZ C-terminal domain
MERLRTAAHGLVGLVIVLAVAGLAAFVAVIVTGGLGSMSALEISSVPRTTRSDESVLLEKHRVPPVPALRAFQIVAARGDCWLTVRDRVATGPVLYEGLLAQGREIRLRRRSIWLVAGAAGNLDVLVDAEPVRLSGTIETVLPRNRGT